MDGFTAQLVEHCTGNVKVMDSVPVEGWFFFQANIAMAVSPYGAHCNLPYCIDIVLTLSASVKRFGHRISDSLSQWLI